LRSSQRGAAKVEAFGRFKFLQVWREGAKELRKEHQQPSDRPIDSGLLVLRVQEELKEEPTEGGDRQASDLTWKSCKPSDREKLRTV
jgi:hypothetical protein